MLQGSNGFRKFPSQELLSLWYILIPKVVVEPDGTLVFHIIDGAEIPLPPFPGIIPTFLAT